MHSNAKQQNKAMDPLETIALQMMESEHFDLDIQNNGEYHIGLGIFGPDGILFENHVPLQVFYNNTGQHILDYLIEISTTITNWDRLEIIKMDFKPCGRWHIYTCVFKTFWLRLVQRRWKKIFAQRRKILQNQALLVKFLTRRSMGCRTSLPLPGIQGMMIA